MKPDCPYREPQVFDLGSIDKIQGLTNQFYFDGGDPPFDSDRY